jgi:hypothetical protein
MLLEEKWSERPGLILCADLCMPLRVAELDLTG